MKNGAGMNQRINELSAQIRALEKELREEIQRIRIHTYEIRDKGVVFRDTVIREHRAQMLRLYQYLRKARLKHILTAPVVWMCLFPALFLDLVVSIYQLVCFPVYGIPKVPRRDYLHYDRHYLAYLNPIEKLNCYFCAYFNGLMGYVSEIAGRTEQYWCPIKHARQMKILHSRYAKFLEYGDADDFHAKAAKLRRDYDDIEIGDRETRQ